MKMGVKNKTKQNQLQHEKKTNRHLKQLIMYNKFCNKRNATIVGKDPIVGKYMNRLSSVTNKVSYSLGGSSIFFRFSYCILI